VYPLFHYMAVEAAFLKSSQPWPLLGTEHGVVGRPAAGCMPRATMAAVRAGGVANPTVRSRFLTSGLGSFRYGRGWVWFG
jgi:hypothetical protein